jgi:hypothetical protein
LVPWDWSRGISVLQEVFCWGVPYLGVLIQSQNLDS